GTRAAPGVVAGPGRRGRHSTTPDTTDGPGGGMAERPPQPARTSRLRAMGRAFASRNYRLFFAGQGVSLVGTWMTRLATGWLVFRLGGADAALLLGVVSFAGLAPTFFVGPLAGALVDRWNRHAVLVVTQVLS